MRTWIVIIVVVLLAGCDMKKEKQKLYTYQKDGDYKQVWVSEIVSDMFTQMESDIERLEWKISELQAYASCPEHRFEFIQKCPGYLGGDDRYLFKCSLCDLKQYRKESQLTEAQRKALRTLEGKDEDLTSGAIIFDPLKTSAG